MPIYEYRCSHCGHVQEFLQKATDRSLKQCPSCEQNSLEKVLSAPSFQLKGTGWYATDFKNSSNKKSATSTNGSTDTTANSASEPATSAHSCTADCSHSKSTS
jgi:putative FmdB family regulatory protein